MCELVCVCVCVLLSFKVSFIAFGDLQVVLSSSKNINQNVQIVYLSYSFKFNLPSSDFIMSDTSANLNLALFNLPE